jgi:hypothetical protein
MKAFNIIGVILSLIVIVQIDKTDDAETGGFLAIVLLFMVLVIVLTNKRKEKLREENRKGD